MAAASSSFYTKTRWYTLGPSVELHLPFGLAGEADVLYKRFEFGQSNDAGVATVSRWEIPLLVKYRFPGWLVRPFIDAGMSFNHVSATGGIARNLAELRHPSAKGYVAGGGLELRLGVVRVGPEMRLTRWGDRNYGVADALLRSNMTEIDFLVGLSF
jgi:hypothetical protein